MTQMPDILERICRTKREEIRHLKEHGEEELADQLQLQSPPRGFRSALASSGRVGIVAEVKKASPSAGVIRADFRPAEIARRYVEGGARCISVLTDEAYFQGNLQHLEEVRGVARLPLLRKDFILDAVQVMESRAWGADCVLLIVAALDPDQLRDLIAEARELGMDSLVEVHDEQELESALGAGADMVGINNRDLRTFEVDLGVSEGLAPMVPPNVLVVAESGIKSRADVERLKRCGVHAVLVGELLMRANDIAAKTRALGGV